MGGNKSRNTAVVRYSRDHSPIHCKLKIESFSELLDLEVEKYETGLFDAGDYRWRLVLYPTGDKQCGGDGYISLYVALDMESEKVKAMSPGWEIKVDLKLFVHDHDHDNYLVFQVMDVAINETTPKRGLAQLLCIQDFTDKRNGYLDGRDCCTFGAEILVMHDSPQSETLSMVRNLGNEKSYTWEIPNFFEIKKKNCHVSEPFQVGGTLWTISVYPNGNGNPKGNWCSVFLDLHDVKTLAPNGKVFAEYKLRILDQSWDKHVEIAGKQWFSASNSSWGSKKFLPCGDLYEKIKGFVLNDTLIIVAEFALVSKIVHYSAA